MKEYIIEIENENVVNDDTLNDITEALNTLGIRLYVYEKEKEWLDKLLYNDKIMG